MTYKPPGFSMDGGWTNAGVPIDAPPYYGQVQPPFPTGPSEDLNATIARQRFINKNTFVNVAAVPTETPPYSGRQLILASGPVMIAPISGDTDATNGATEVATAVGRFATLTTQTPTATTDYVTVLSYTLREGIKAVFRGVGVWAHDYQAQEMSAVLWNVIVSGLPLFTTDLQLGSLCSLDALADIFYVAKAGDLISVVIRNLDQRSGTLVEARLNGWEFPVSQQDDSLQSLIPNQTIDSNGRYSVGMGSCGGPSFQNGGY
jgi:hypothetical protein